jgi:alpha-tubulin suppressor-like RCC1 family protein
MPTPAPVPGLSRGVVSVGVGWYHTCAIVSDFAVKCWGFDGYTFADYGLLGLNYRATKCDSRTCWEESPQNVHGLSSGVLMITAGHYHTCVVLISGSMQCWGFNYNMEGNNDWGVGNTSPWHIPRTVTGLSVRSISEFHNSTSIESLAFQPTVICPAGTFATANSSNICSPCPAGRFCVAGCSNKEGKWFMQCR